MDKYERIMELFLRAWKGEDISVHKLAAQYNVSTKSVSRDIKKIRNYLDGHQELSGNAVLIYDYGARAYRMDFDGRLSGEELLVLLKIIMENRLYDKDYLEGLMKKLGQMVFVKDKELLRDTIREGINQESGM